MARFPIPSHYKIPLINARGGLEASSIEDVMTASMVVVGVDEYGAVGDGVTDDTAAIQRAENARPAGFTLKFTPGKTYATTANTPARLLRVLTAGAWDLTGATLKLTAASFPNDGTSDGGPTGLVNILASGFALVGMGTIDGANLAFWPVVIDSQVSGCRLDVTLINVKEPRTWSGLFEYITTDVPGSNGSAAPGRAVNVSGLLRRPACPIQDNTNAVSGHSDVTAILWGDALQKGNSSGGAYVSSGFNNFIASYRIDVVGIPKFIFIADSNTRFLDIGCYDLGAALMEGNGASAAASVNYGMNGVDAVGFVAKSASAHIYGHGNLGTDGTKPSLVAICRAAGQAEANFDYDSGGLSGGRVVHKQTTPTEAVLVSGIDARNQDQVFITLTAARVVGAPVGPIKGQRIIWNFVQGGAGGFAITWNAIFKGINWSDAGNVTGARAAIETMYDGTNWSQVVGQSVYHA